MPQQVDSQQPLTPPTGKIVIQRQTKRSGVTNCAWNAANSHWQVYWKDDGCRQSKLFTRHQYMAPGKSVEQADNDALVAALAHRATLVQQGLIKEKRTVRSSGVVGVNWKPDKNSWRVEDPGEKRTTLKLWTTRWSRLKKHGCLQWQRGKSWSGTTITF